MSFKPKDAVGINIVDSRWQNQDIEEIAQNIVFVQFMLNANHWSPFTWEDYVSHSLHNVTRSEFHVLEAMTFGGEPIKRSSINLEAGYLEKDGEYYLVTNKFKEVVGKAMHVHMHSVALPV